MGKLGMLPLVSTLLASCTYGADRLLPPVEGPPVADASPSDTPPDRREPDVWWTDFRDAGVAGHRDAGTGGPDDPDAGGASGATASKVEGATFVSGHAQGALTGQAYVSLGVIDTVTSPTCNGMQIGGLSPSMPPVTFNSTCRPSAITWDSATGLCVSGIIPGSSSNPSNIDYMIDWGIMVGVATREPVQAIGVAYSNITLTVSG